MIYPAIIFSLITLAAGMILVYRNKVLNERQACKVSCELKVTSRRIHRN